ncbi:MAG: carbohydrate ABC transporter permease [Actinomycetaceae bacterium]|nr:carbohydrate ABC transporter permease [Actinomycetaceae bacterium]
MSSEVSVATLKQTAGPGIARAAAKKRRRRSNTAIGSSRQPGVFNYTFLILVLIISAAPLYYAFLLASSNAAEIAQNPIPSLIPQGEFFDNLGRVRASGLDLMGALINSVIVAVITSLSVVFFSTLAGFAFSKLRFRGREGLLTFVIATMAIPAQLGVIPLFMVMAKLGWTGELKAVIIPAMVSAFGVFWMTQYIRDALPYELIESARVDGASLFRVFWSISMPIARPAASMLGLFTFVGSWTNFFWPFIVLGASKPTLPVALQLLQASYFKDYSLIMTGVVIATVPLLLLFFFAGRQLVSGIMQGAVKG